MIRTTLSSFSGLSLLILATAAADARTPAPDGTPQAAPPGFVENAGQWPAWVRFGRHLGAGSLAVGDRRLVVLPGGDPARAVQLVFEGADSGAQPHGVAPRAGRSSWLIGSDPDRWGIGARSFESVRVSDLHPGVDLVVRESETAAVRYDLELAADAQLDAVRVRCEGVEALEVAEDGSLAMHTPAGTITQSAPVAWSVLPDGTRRAIACRFAVRGPHTYGFEAPGRDPGLPAVVDPGLDWSSYLGGSKWESAYAAAADGSGGGVVVGQTGSSDFPTTPGVVDPGYNGMAFSDVFVTRFDRRGRILWSTFVGGTNGEEARAVAIDGAGVVTVAGVTASSGFPTTPGAVDTTLSGSSDVFVLRLTADGTGLVFSTFLGGGAGDVARDLALLPSGDVLVAGVTSSAGFPTTGGAYDTTLAGTSDAFLLRLDASGTSLVWSTLLGGTSGDTGMCVGVHPGGDAIVGGVTSSSDFPTTGGAFDTVQDGTSDAFAARVASDGSALVWSTFVGGSSGDTGECLAVDAFGRVTLGGVTSSSDFPTTAGAYDEIQEGASDGFVARLVPDGSALDYATVVGGSGADNVLFTGIDGSGVAFAGGVTSSGDFPVTTGAFDATPGGSGDGFVIRLDPAGSALVYSSLIGGGSGETAEGGGAAASGSMLIVGTSSSTDFPLTPAAGDPVESGSSESFAASVTMLPAGVERFGTQGRSCLGSVVAGVSGSPQAGSSSFAFTCASAPVSTSGWMVVTVGAGRGVPGAATEQLFALFTLTQGGAITTAIPVTADGTGYVSVPWPLTGSAPGDQLRARFVWPGDPTCPTESDPLVSATLRVTVQ